MSEITPNQWTILESLKDGAVWARSYQPVKPLLKDLIERKLVDRCRPYLGRGHNMVRLSPEGCELLEIDAAAIPAFRDTPLNACTAKRSRDKRSNAGVGRHSNQEPIRVECRDPCPRCGVRGDLGCGHSKAPLSMGL